MEGKKLSDVDIGQNIIFTLFSLERKESLHSWSWATEKGSQKNIPNFLKCGGAFTR